MQRCLDSCKQRPGLATQADQYNRRDGGRADMVQYSNTRRPHMFRYSSSCYFVRPSPALLSPPRLHRTITMFSYLASECDSQSASEPRLAAATAAAAADGAATWEEGRRTTKPESGTSNVWISKGADLCRNCESRSAGVDLWCRSVQKL